MSRIAACMERRRGEQRSALVPYLVAGDSVNPGGTLALMHVLSRAGADIIELGCPFSDPMAEGPVIQRAHQRSLENGTTLQSVLHTVSEFRSDNAETPVVLMGYVNPVEQYGYSQFAADAGAAGVDGLLLVDMPAESALEFSRLLREAGLDMIFLATLTTSTGRLQKIVKLATGYLYYVSLKGVTGADSLQLEELAAGLEQLRALSTVPVCAGFGVKTPEMAAAVGRIADGVVVGSLLIARLEACAVQGRGGEPGNDGDAETAAETLVRSFRASLDGQKTGDAA